MQVSIALCLCSVLLCMKELHVRKKLLSSCTLSRKVQLIMPMQASRQRMR